MRSIDDIADSVLCSEEKIKLLNDFYQTTKAVFSPQTHAGMIDPFVWDKSSFWPAFQQTVQVYQIPFRYFEDMFLGQLQSVQQNSYQNFPDLYQYCYRVAATVGLACLSIWGCQGGETAKKLAEYRGIALQLINVARDIYWDACVGKSFIPLTLMGGHEVLSVEQLVLHEDSVAKAVGLIIEQAEYYYQQSRSLEQLVSKKGSLSLFIMSQNYWIILKKIKKNPRLVLGKKTITLRPFEKVFLCIKGIVKWCLVG